MTLTGSLTCVQLDFVFPKLCLFCYSSNSSWCPGASRMPQDRDTVSFVSANQLFSLGWRTDHAPWRPSSLTPAVGFSREDRALGPQNLRPRPQGSSQQSAGHPVLEKSKKGSWSVRPDARGRDKGGPHTQLIRLRKTHSPGFELEASDTSTASETRLLEPCGCGPG